MPEENVRTPPEIAVPGQKDTRTYQDRRDYHRRTRAVRRHIDWHLRESLGKLPGQEWTTEQIEEAMASDTGFSITWATIRRYNTDQFTRFHMAPLDRVSEHGYALNQHYYELMGEYVCLNGTPKPGPRPKHMYG